MGIKPSNLERERVFNAVLDFLKVTHVDIVRFDCTFFSNGLSEKTTHYSVRVDYSPLKGGGYQILEGDLTSKWLIAVSPVLGRGRVTPKFPLTPTVPVRSREEVEEERRRLDTEFEFGIRPLDDGRTN